MEKRPTGATQTDRWPKSAVLLGEEPGIFFFTEADSEENGVGTSHHTSSNGTVEEHDWGEKKSTPSARSRQLRDICVSITETKPYQTRGLRTGK